MCILKHSWTETAVIVLVIGFYSVLAYFERPFVYSDLSCQLCCDIQKQYPVGGVSSFYYLFTIEFRRYWHQVTFWHTQLLNLNSVIDFLHLSNSGGLESVSVVIGRAAGYTLDRLAVCHMLTVTDSL